MKDNEKIRAIKEMIGTLLEERREPRGELSSIYIHAYETVLTNIEKIEKEEKWETERQRLARVNLGKPCTTCGRELTEEDMQNSLYGTHYLLCRECASTISV